MVTAGSRPVAGLPTRFFWRTVIDLRINWVYQNSKPRGSANFRPGSNPSHEGVHTAQANTENSTISPAVSTRRRFLSQAAGVAAGGTVLALGRNCGARGLMTIKPTPS
jgi:hypothetical protein